MGAVVLWGGSPAHADIDGPCQAGARFEPAPGGSTAPIDVDLASADVVEVSHAGSVAWYGQIGDGLDTEPRSVTGSARLELPPLINAALGGLADVYTWGADDATRTEASGTTPYDIPTIVPAGAEIVVTATHSDALGTCSGEITLRLAGNPLAEPVTLTLLLLTAGSATMLVLAGKP